MDPASHQLSASERHRPGLGGHGGGRPSHGFLPSLGHPVHRQPRHWGTVGNHHQRQLRPWRSRGQWAGDARHLHRRQGNVARQGNHHRPEGAADRRPRQSGHAARRCRCGPSRAVLVDRRHAAAIVAHRHRHRDALRRRPPGYRVGGRRPGALPASITPRHQPAGTTHRGGLGTHATRQDPLPAPDRREHAGSDLSAVRGALPNGGPRVRAQRQAQHDARRRPELRHLQRLRLQPRRPPQQPRRPEQLRGEVESRLQADDRRDLGTPGGSVRQGTTRHGAVSLRALGRGTGRVRCRRRRLRRRQPGP